MDSKEPQPVPESVKQIIGNEAANRFPFQEYIRNEGSKIMKSDKGVFMDGADFGYLLASLEISTLQKTIEEQKKEIERLKLIVENCKKLMSIADVPKLLIEHPNLLLGTPTEKDIEWAEGVIRDYENNNL